MSLYMRRIRLRASAGEVRGGDRGENKARRWRSTYDGAASARRAERAVYGSRAWASSPCTEHRAWNIARCEVRRSGRLRLIALFSKKFQFRDRLKVLGPASSALGSDQRVKVQTTAWHSECS